METSKSKFNYGWISFIGVFICIFCTFGIGSGTHAIYNPENIARLGVSTAVYMTPVGTTGIMTAITCLCYPFLERKITARGVLECGAVGYAIAFVVLGTTTDMIGIWIGYLLIGICNGCTFITVFSTITDSWFAKNKALMAGIIGFGANFSTTIWSNATRAVIDQVGFQSSYYIFAAICFIAGTVGVLLARNHPKNVTDMIWYQPGISLDEPNEKRVPVMTALRESLKKKKVILALVCVVFIGFCFHPISLSFTNVMAAKGIDAVTIAAMLGIYYLCIAIYKIVAGVLTDNVGIRWALMSILAFAIVGLVIMIIMPEGNVTLGYVATVLLGFAASATTYATACMVMTAVPRHDYYVSMLGVVTCLFSVCNAIATVAMAAVYDSFGSYTPALYVMIGFCIILVVLGWMFSSGYGALNKEAEKRAEDAEEPITNTSANII